MRVIFAGGGTGGHINPALSIAGYAAEHDANFEALFIGTERGLEKKLVPRAGYKIEYINIEGFDRKHLLKNIKVFSELRKSEKICRKLIRSFKPDCIVCTGGYVSGPVALAAHKEKVPALIHEQNVYPGLTVTASERYVTYVAVSFDETVNHMKRKDKCVVTGNPVRGEIVNADRDSARRSLNIPADEPFVLVFGGSLGADRINDAVIQMLGRISSEKKFRLLFGTGDRNYNEVIRRVKESGTELGSNIEIVPYINNMDAVMAASDLVVCRSGAITVSELAVLQKPSVLIPSPNVVRNHQEQNAREIESKGGAVVICEKDLTPEHLYDTVCSLVGDTDALSRMSKSLESVKKSDACAKIFELMKKMSNK